MIQKYKFLVFDILKKKRLCFFSTSLLFLVMTVFFLFFSLYNGISVKYSKLKIKYIKQNYIVFKNENLSNQEKINIENNPYVIAFYPSLYYKTSEIDFVYLDDNLIDLVSGKKICSKNEIIVPEDTNYKINDLINIKFNGINYILKVVGISKPNNFNYNFETSSSSTFYASYELMSEVLKNSEKYEFIVQVDDYNNVENFIENLEQIENYKIRIFSENTQELNRYEKFLITLSVVKNAIVLFLFLLIVIINMIIIYDNRLNISIMKVFGYSNRKIIFLIISYFLIFIVLSIPISMILLIILLIFFKDLLIFDVRFILYIFMSYGISLLLTIVLLYIIVKKINIIKLLKC